MLSLQKKKDKKKKDKRRSRSVSSGRHRSPENGGPGRNGGGSPKVADDAALSESELESQRAALLAQLSEQMDE